MLKPDKKQPKRLSKAYVRLGEQTTQKAELWRKRQSFRYSKNVVEYPIKRQTRFSIDANILRHFRKNRPFLSFELAEKMKKVTNLSRRPLAEILEQLFAETKSRKACGRNGGQQWKVAGEEGDRVQALLPQALILSRLKRLGPEPEVVLCVGLQKRRPEVEKVSRFEPKPFKAAG